jgi:hypothetical protein
MEVGKEYSNESFTVNTEALRQMQDYSAQRQSLCDLRKSKAQTATGLNYGEN